jgi:hypothetical protein
MSFDARAAAAAADRPATEHACRSCREPSDWATLSALGGWCRPCYAAFCRGVDAARVSLTLAERQAAIARLAQVSLLADDGMTPAEHCARRIREIGAARGYLSRPQKAQLEAIDAMLARRGGITSPEERDAALRADDEWRRQRDGMTP